jgi:hypothetical protein
VKCIKVLAVKNKRNRPIGRSRFPWEDNIKMNLKEIGWKGVDSYSSEYGSGAGCCDHGNEYSGFPKMLVIF